jgi:hypothetical protein
MFAFFLLPVLAFFVVGGLIAFFVRRRYVTSYETVTYGSSYNNAYPSPSGSATVVVNAQTSSPGGSYYSPPAYTQQVIL